MKFDCSVTTILVCYKCHRNVMISSENTWTHNIMNKPVAKEWAYLTLVHCSSCLISGMDAYTGMKMLMIPENIPQSAHDMTMFVQRSYCVPVIMHVSKHDDNRPHPGEKVYTDWDETYLVVENVHKVMSNMLGRYTISSMYEDNIVEPHGDFIMFDQAGQMPFLLYLTPMLVNNIMICTLCWRNVIFTGSSSIMQVDKSMVRGNCMNLIMYACCDTCAGCEGANSSTNEDVIESLYANEERVAITISYFAKNLGNDVYIYKDVANNMDKVVDANTIMQRLTFTSEKWSLVKGKKMGPYVGFV